jgi:hypothetical protein
MTKLYDTALDAAKGFSPKNGLFNSEVFYSSPKYSEDNQSTKTLARLFIPMTPEDADRYSAAVRRSVKGDIKDILDSLIVRVSGVPLGGGYLYFLLGSASEPHRENLQVVQTMSDDYVTYTFGESPPVFTYTGILPNTLQSDWRIAFYLLYDQLVRASKLALYRKSVVLSYDNLLITGALASLDQNLRAEAQTYASFNFGFLVKKITVLSRSKITPISASEADSAAFGIGITGTNLLGLVASVSGSGVSSPTPLKTSADSAPRASGDSAPTKEESEAATVASAAANAVLTSVYPYAIPGAFPVTE